MVEWSSCSWLAEQGVRGLIASLATSISEIGYLPLQINYMTERLKQCKILKKKTQPNAIRMKCSFADCNQGETGLSFYVSTGGVM